MKTRYSNHSYQDIIDHFSREKVEQRYLFLLGLAKHFIKSRYKYLFKIDEYFWISEKIIGEIVLNYFSDVLRLKQFHNIKNTEKQKVAAFTAYWVARCKPIQIIKDFPSDIVNKEKGIYFVNESYACNLLIAMTHDTTKPILQDYGNLEKFTKNLNYHLTYRLTTPQMLELTLYALHSNPIYAPLS